MAEHAGSAHRIEAREALRSSRPRRPAAFQVTFFQPRAQAPASANLIARVLLFTHAEICWSSSPPEPAATPMAVAPPPATMSVASAGAA